MNLIEAISERLPRKVIIQTFNQDRLNSQDAKIMGAYVYAAKAEACTTTHSSTEA